ncbi:hypothetical protein ACQPW3_25280 [Actinosynnema sp. CA-248983]
MVQDEVITLRSGRAFAVDDDAVLAASAIHALPARDVPGTITVHGRRTTRLTVTPLR